MTLQQQNTAPKFSSVTVGTLATTVAHPLAFQKLESCLDMTGFINQVEAMLDTPIDVSDSASSSCKSTTSQSKSTASDGASSNSTERSRSLLQLYNFKPGDKDKRKWLQNIILEDSDSDSDADQPITEEDLMIILKIHKTRRKYQKIYHSDILNSQYTYYAAGLLSETDKFPEHQKSVLKEYGFTGDVAGPSTAHPRPCGARPTAAAGNGVASRSASLAGTSLETSSSGLVATSSSVAIPVKRAKRRSASGFARPRTQSSSATTRRLPCASDYANIADVIDFVVEKEKQSTTPKDESQADAKQTDCTSECSLPDSFSEMKTEANNFNHDCTVDERSSAGIQSDCSGHQESRDLRDYPTDEANRTAYCGIYGAIGNVFASQAVKPEPSSSDFSFDLGGHQQRRDYLEESLSASVERKLFQQEEIAFSFPFPFGSDVLTTTMPTGGHVANSELVAQQQQKQRRPPLQKQSFSFNSNATALGASASGGRSKVFKQPKAVASLKATPSGDCSIKISKVKTSKAIHSATRSVSGHVTISARPPSSAGSLKGGPTDATALGFPLLGVRPSISGADLEMLRRKLWRHIAVDEIPKIYNEKYIFRKYRGIVLKNMAMWCESYVFEKNNPASSSRGSGSSGRGGKAPRVVARRSVTGLPDGGGDGSPSSCTSGAGKSGKPKSPRKPKQPSKAALRKSASIAALLQAFGASASEPASPMLATPPPSSSLSVRIPSASSNGSGDSGGSAPAASAFVCQPSGSAFPPTTAPVATTQPTTVVCADDTPGVLGGTLEASLLRQSAEGEANARLLTFTQL